MKKFLKIVGRVILVGVISFGFLICIIESNSSKRVSESGKEIRIKKIVSSEGHQYNLFLNDNRPFSMEHRLDCKKCFEEFD